MSRQIAAAIAADRAGAGSRRTRASMRRGRARAELPGKALHRGARLRPAAGGGTGRPLPASSRLRPAAGRASATDTGSAAGSRSS
jgi:hypothetical protein